jgi:hypothetical protein
VRKGGVLFVRLMKAEDEKATLFLDFIEKYNQITQTEL